MSNNFFFQSVKAIATYTQSFMELYMYMYFQAKPQCARVWLHEMSYSNICSPAAFWLKISVFLAITACFLVNVALF